MAVFRTLPRRRKRHNLVVFFIIIAYILWVEVLALHFKALFWKVPAKGENSICLLLVADPQLIGYKNENKFIGWLSRFDSDRYMKRAFDKVVSKTQPNYVIFLGDLFDEGVTMSSREFEWTMERFREIYPMSNQTNKIFIAGDNDIGGEAEPVYQNLQQRFDRSFPNQVQQKVAKMFEFSEVNIFDEAKLRKIVDGDGLKILLSHVPVIRSMQSFQRAFTNYKPDLVISAHDHTAEYYVKKHKTDQFTRHEASKGLRFSVSAGMPLVEIQVPTTSYRMGMHDMGIGHLTIEFVPHTRAFTISYENYWLVGRYPQLYGYGFLILILFLYYFGAWFIPILKFMKIDVLFRKLCKRKPQKYMPV